jgi:hypothetical protein
VVLVEGPVYGSGWGGGLGERGLLGRCEHAGSERSLVWGAGGVVASDGLGADALA